MNEIEIYIHSPFGQEPKLMRISDEATVGDLVKKLPPEVILAAGNDLAIIIEDQEEVLLPDRKLNECGIKHRHHLHCHSCRHINVFVSYNGVQKEKRFSPATMVKNVLRWALYTFGLKGVDAENKVLRLSDGVELPSDSHIGSFAKSPECELKLTLTPIVRVQG
jgi:hypothetical protein